MLKDLFIPPEDYFNDKVQALKDKFSFVDIFIVFFESFKEFFNERDFSSAPKIDMDLDAAESIYNYGLSGIALDLSWYERYKPSVDIVIGSILWGVFIWNTARDVPSIIQGLAVVNVVSDSGKE